MKKYQCTICGEVIESDTMPEVCPVCGVDTFIELDEAAEKVYSEDYLEGIYQVAFEGVGGSSYGIKMARFYTEGGLLRQYNQLESYIDAHRVYDYDTLKIIRPSNDEFMNITVDTHLEGEEEILKVTLRFVKGEDGEWYLDSPTY